MLGSGRDLTPGPLTPRVRLFLKGLGAPGCFVLAPTSGGAILWCWASCPPSLPNLAATLPQSPHGANFGSPRLMEFGGEGDKLPSLSALVLPAV